MAFSNNVNMDQLINSEGMKADVWNWSDNFVQADINLGTSGQLVSADSTLIAVGPPTVQPMITAVKVGLSPSFSLSQQIPQNRVAEIGSRRVHIINGTPIGGGSISRFLYNGPTLLRLSYSVVFTPNGRLKPEAEEWLRGGTTDNVGQQGIVDAWNNLANQTTQWRTRHQQTNFWISCWDNKFKFPIGMAILHQDAANNSIGAYYLEGVKYNMHNISKQASQLVLAENLSFSFDRMIPVVAMDS